jgi:thioredoxin-dependent peroxiredoxin
MIGVGAGVPQTNFLYRVRTDGKDICYVDETNGGENPFEWKELSTADIFSDKRVVVFSLPGAFTPTCSTFQVPGFEQNYDKMKSLGVDEVYVISVNDTFVMRQWMIHQKVKNIKFIPDGSGKFTAGMGALVAKDNLGFGVRSWRYAMVVNDGIVEYMGAEDGIMNNCETDPYVNSTPEKVLEYLENA